MMRWMPQAAKALLTAYLAVEGAKLVRRLKNGTSAATSSGLKSLDAYTRKVKARR